MQTLKLFHRSQPLPPVGEIWRAGRAGPSLQALLGFGEEARRDIDKKDCWVGSCKMGQKACETGHCVTDEVYLRDTITNADKAAELLGPGYELA